MSTLHVAAGAAAVAAATYAIGGSTALAITNDYQALLAVQGVSILVLAVIAYYRPSMRGLDLWTVVLGLNFVARLISLPIVPAATNKAAKFRRWDALATTVSYGVTLAYLMTSLGRTKSVGEYAELAVVAIPTVTAMLLATIDTHEYDLGEYADLASLAYTSPTFTDPKTDTRVLVSQNATALVVAFAGTASKQNVKTDLRAADTSFPACGNPKTRVHAGFSRAWAAVRDRVLKIVMASDDDDEGHHRQIVFTGHSLGGALAVLAAADVSCTAPPGGLESSSKLRVVTFGAPQVGDELFADTFNASVPRSTRVVNPLDPVPKSLSAQLTHVKGLYYVPAVSGNPHGMAAYKKAVGMSRISGLSVMAVPLVLVVSIALVSRVVRAKF